MRAVVQRVKKASVKVDEKVVGAIEKGLCVLIAVGDEDDEAALDWTAKKIMNLRVFPDEEGKMNLSALDVGGGVLMISNFTVYGDPHKGYRPNFMKAALPEKAEPMFDAMVERMRQNYDAKIETGVFGAMMEVEIINDGPVTVIIEK